MLCGEEKMGMRCQLVARMVREKKLPDKFSFPLISIFPFFRVYFATFSSVNVVDGEILSITKVSRLHMAAYLCVASNGVPPSISKRVQLKVQCKDRKTDVKMTNFMSFSSLFPSSSNAFDSESVGRRIRRSRRYS